MASTDTITIQLPRGPDTVPAKIYGAFAVHGMNGDPLDEVRRYWGADAWYAVSHVPTGRLVIRVKGRRNADTLARRLNKAIVYFNPSEEDAASASAGSIPEPYAAMVSRMKSIIEQFDQEHPGQLEPRAKTPAAEAGAGAKDEGRM